MHKSSTLTLLDQNGTEPSFVSLLTPVFTLVFLAKMAALKKVHYKIRSGKMPAISLSDSRHRKHKCY